MSDLNTKLNSTLSSVNNIETALESKSGQNLDSTPLSDYDDIINALEILTSTMMNNINSIEDTGSSYEAKLSSAVSSMNTQVTNLKNKISAGMNLSGDIVKKITQCYNLQNQFIGDVNTNIKKLGYTSTVSTTEQVSTAINSLKTSWNSVITAINNKLGTSISTSGNFNPSSIVTEINNAQVSGGDGEDFVCTLWNRNSNVTLYAITEDGLKAAPSADASCSGSGSWDMDGTSFRFTRYGQDANGDNSDGACGFFTFSSRVSSTSGWKTMMGSNPMGTTIYQVIPATTSISVRTTATGTGTRTCYGLYAVRPGVMSGDSLIYYCP